jgi:hypothetical protein
MGIRKNYFATIVKIEKDTRHPIRCGKHRVWVDREHDGSFTILLPDGGLRRFARSLDAALFLREFANTNHNEIRRHLWPVI